MVFHKVTANRQRTNLRLQATLSLLLQGVPLICIRIPLHMLATRVQAVRQPTQLLPVLQDTTLRPQVIREQQAPPQDTLVQATLQRGILVQLQQEITLLPQVLQL